VAGHARSANCSSECWQKPVRAPRSGGARTAEGTRYRRLPHRPRRYRDDPE
jgi:hypothetical protein